MSNWYTEKGGREVDPIKKVKDYMREFDLRTFQELPLHIKARLLREGKFLFMGKEDMMYDIAIRAIREFEDFRGNSRISEGIRGFQREFEDFRGNSRISEGIRGFQAEI
jgi:hypothetical protein